MSERTRADGRQHDLADEVTGAHILVCTGAGGVGKTTTAAALGLAGARAGRRTLVLTIDPARRLAQSMGIEELGNTPQRVPLDGGAGGGQLWAMMLDMQRTFDDVLDRHAPTPERADAIRRNRIYQTLSSTLAGTQEYMAMEKLHALDEEGDWDLLVVDTPPTRNALDFLDAPRRMTDFLEGRLLKLFIRPGMAAGRGMGRLVGFGTQKFMQIAGRVTGMELLEDLADFFRNFQGMYEGFKQRAQEVRALLEEPGSRFVVVATPQPPPLREAHFFLDRLQQEGLHTAAVVINRIHPHCGGWPHQEDACPDAVVLEAVAQAQPNDTEGRAVAGALRLLADTNNLATRERRDVSAALYGVAPPPLVEVPLLRSDVHDLETLGEIADALTDSA
ncbi:MAG: AAA family ATPase [Actinobacteria bacterium]|nr:AAA family ATPase [Actinomycetota bacterium]